GGGRRRHPPQAEAGDDVEEEEVAEAEDAFELSHGFVARHRRSVHTKRVSVDGISRGRSGCNGSPGITRRRRPSCSTSFGSRRTTSRVRAHASASSTEANGSISRTVIQVGGGRTISFAVALPIAPAAVTQLPCVVSVSSCAGV